MRSARSTGEAGSPSSGASAERGTPGVQTPSTGRTAAPDSGGSTPAGGPATASSADATLVAGTGGDIAGGDPSAAREPVGDVPTPPPGARADPDEVAPPEPNVNGLQLLIDADASEPGIQASRTVNAGDVIRVAIVAANASDIAAFNYFVDYNRAVAIAPSYTGGSTTDRNPDLDEGTAGAGWSCLPAPEGDTDDPGGINGDGNPATGQALLSCFNVGGTASGTVILGIVEFRTVAPGTLTLGLSSVTLGNSGGAEIGRCESDQTPGPAIPCIGASVVVN